MSLLFTWIPAVASNALPYDQIMASDDVLQSLADYISNNIGEELYNLTAGLLGTAWQWLFMGMSESEFNEMLNAFFDIE
jgi:hypothetical protein